MDISSSSRGSRSSSISSGRNISSSSSSSSSSSGVSAIAVNILQFVLQLLLRRVALLRITGKMHVIAVDTSCSVLNCQRC